jgi:hypothetical protein
MDRAIKEYQAPVRKALQKLHDEEYKPQDSAQDDTPEFIPKLDFLNGYLEDTMPAEKVVKDQFKYYSIEQQSRILP